jgi:hypothetical protein
MVDSKELWWKGVSPLGKEVSMRMQQWMLLWDMVI